MYALCQKQTWIGYFAQHERVGVVAEPTVACGLWSIASAFSTNAEPIADRQIP